MSFVLRRKSDGMYAYGRSGKDLAESLQHARVYPRKVDAKNSAKWWRQWGRRPEDWEVVPVKLVEESVFDGLLSDADKLARLEAYGVDNWQGYSDALRDTDNVFGDGPA